MFFLLRIRQKIAVPDTTAASFDNHGVFFHANFFVLDEKVSYLWFSLKLTFHSSGESTEGEYHTATSGGESPFPVKKEL